MRLNTLFVAGAAALTLALSGGAVVAKNAGNKHGGMNCPPGLAKKNPPCVPPGLAKKGDIVFDYPYAWIDPRDHGFDGRYGWYRIGDNLIVRTDKETGEIIELFNAIAAVLD